MQRGKWSLIWATASVIGGLFFTLLSGLYIKKPLIVDAEIIYFGFPLAWLEAGRSTWMPKSSRWHYYFFWQGFITDFIIYGLLTAAAFYIYLIAITAFRRLFSSALIKT